MENSFGPIQLLAELSIETQANKGNPGWHRLVSDQCTARDAYYRDDNLNNMKHGHGLQSFTRHEGSHGPPSAADFRQVAQTLVD